MTVCDSVSSSIGDNCTASGYPRSILVVHNSFSRFVEIDCELLARHCCVTVRHETSPWRLRFAQICGEVGKHDLVYCWFASWHSLLPVLAARFQGKPSVVVVGGYDTASVPQAAYGSQRGGVRKYLARAVMQLATHLVVNSFAARAEVVKNVGVSPEKVTVVYHGIPQRNDAVQGARIRMALTVGVISRENLLRKGLLPFVQASHLLPDVRFVHAGPVLDDSIKELYRAASTNVEFLGRLSDEDLEALYDRASVYVQASLHEGFGMSVAEAMAAGCIPVVSRHGSLPEVVGDTGVLLSDTTADGVVQGIARALDATDAARFNAQKRVRKLFSLDQREHKLRKVLDHLIETQRN